MLKKFSCFRKDNAVQADEGAENLQTVFQKRRGRPTRSNLAFFMCDSDDEQNIYLEIRTLHL